MGKFFSNKKLISWNFYSTNKFWFTCSFVNNFINITYISINNIFIVRFSHGKIRSLRDRHHPVRLNVRASRARLIIIVFDILYKANWLKRSYFWKISIRDMNFLCYNYHFVCFLEKLRKKIINVLCIKKSLYLFF